MTYWNPEDIQLLQTAESIIEEHSIYIEGQLIKAENHRIDTVYAGSISSILLCSIVAMEHIDPKGWVEYPYETAQTGLSTLAICGIIVGIQSAYRRREIYKGLVE